MKIPWLTPVLAAIADGKIAALLEHQVTQLTKERDDALAQLRNANANLEVLEAKIKKLAPKTEVDAEAGKVLLCLSQGGGELTCYQIADTSGISLERVQRHLGYLRQLKFTRWALARTTDFDPPHRITEAGSEFLYQNGLI